MDQNYTWEQLAKYFAGELTIEENTIMDAWIEADPEREQQVQFLHTVWKESGGLPYWLDVDEAWETLENKMDRYEDHPEPFGHQPSGSGDKRDARVLSFKNRVKSFKRPGKLGRRLAMAAASILIMVTAGYFAYQHHTELREAEQAEEIVYKELQTSDGERATYTLSDGSKMVLHAGSRVEIPETFNTDNRELYLEGEAYFEVHHDEEKPFIVRTEDTYTRVLGTKFLTQAWPEENRDVEVIVEEGKVAFGGNNAATSNSEQQEILLERNQRGIFAADASLNVREVSDMHWHLGWIEGRMEFEDRKLSEIFPRLERWYAVKIDAEDPGILEKRLTAEIDYDQPMTEVLKGIALSLDLEVEQEQGERSVLFREAGDI